jgi:hypothetical protein
MLVIWSLPEGDVKLHKDHPICKELSSSLKAGSDGIGSEAMLAQVRSACE